MYMKIKNFNDVYKRFLILFIKLCREVLFEINTIINCTKKSKLIKKIRIKPCSLLPNQQNGRRERRAQDSNHRLAYGHLETYFTFYFCK